MKTPQFNLLTQVSEVPVIQMFEILETQFMRLMGGVEIYKTQQFSNILQFQN